MKIINSIKIISKYILIFIFLFIFSAIYLFGGLVSNAASEYSSVIQDLQRDSTFNIEDYPDNITDFNLYVIQIGETEDKQLIIYVYQPSHYTIDIKASKVSISYGFSSNGKDLNSSIYDLELIDTEGVLDKYLVKDFEVPNDSYRYYNIVSIYRQFNKKIDEYENEFSNLEYISIGVGQQWCCYYLNDKIVYEMNTFKILDIDINMWSFVGFRKGLKLNNFTSNCETGICWYLCFNVNDFDIKHIYDVDLSYF